MSRKRSAGQPVTKRQLTRALNRLYRDLCIVIVATPAADELEAYRSAYEARNRAGASLGPRPGDEF